MAENRGVVEVQSIDFSTLALSEYLGIITLSY